MLSERFIEFVSGGIASCLAEVLTLPLDTIKTRIMENRSSKSTLWTVLMRTVSSRAAILDGMLKGLDAALIRQLVFGTLRFGLYPIFADALTARGLALGHAKIVGGFLSGALASAIANPTDLVKVRMQGRNYKYSSAPAAFWAIARDEGVSSFYIGVLPTVMRSSVIAAVELSSYHSFKSLLCWYLSLAADDGRVFVLAALAASVLTAFFSCPFEVARSRMMSQLHAPKKLDADGDSPQPRAYRNFFDCVATSVREEGVGVLWKGLFSWFLRLGPNAILTFFFLERARAVLSALSATTPYSAPLRR